MELKTSIALLFIEVKKSPSEEGGFGAENKNFYLWARLAIEDVMQHFTDWAE